MIGYLRGRIVDRGLAEVTVDVHGVGYEVVLDKQSRLHLGPEGSESALWIRTVVREDAITLFGFDSEMGRVVFDLLVTVSGVGPRMASAILGGFPLPELVEAVRDKNLKKLTQISGVGKKTAERLCLELQEKFFALPIQAPSLPTGVSKSLYEDARSALANLGFAARDVEEALKLVEPGPTSPTLEALVRQALARLSAR